MVEKRKIHIWMRYTQWERTLGMNKHNQSHIRLLLDDMAKQTMLLQKKAENFITDFRSAGCFFLFCIMTSYQS